ncbi:hypothetical protein D3C80_1486000 [compost metagenome]
MRQFDGRRLDEGIDGTVHQARRGTGTDGVMAGDAGGEGERTTIVDEFPPNQQQVDLAHELVAKAQGELVFGHFSQRGKRHVAGCADQGIEATGLLEQVANRCAVADIHLVVTAAATDTNHLMTLFQFLGYR